MVWRSTAHNKRAAFEEPGRAQLGKPEQALDALEVAGQNFWDSRLEKTTNKL